VKSRLVLVVSLLFLMTASISFAGWHSGKIMQVAVGYDGKTITIIPEGWVRTDCTCYPAWSNMMCLDSLRETYDFEKSLVLTANATRKTVYFNIDETTCKIIAIYELG